MESVHQRFNSLIPGRYGSNFPNTSQITWANLVKFLSVECYKTSMILVNIGSDNVSVLLSNKPSPEPMLPNFYDAIWRHYTTNHNTSVWCSQCRRGKSDTVIGTLSITRIVATSILLFFSKCHCFSQGHVAKKSTHIHIPSPIPSQWETALFCNDVSHWLGANIQSALLCCVVWFTGCQSRQHGRVHVVCYWLDAYLLPGHLEHL